MDDLENAIKKCADKANTSLLNQVTKEDKYAGVCWYWDSLSEQYISTEDSYITARLCHEPLFKSKESARKYRSSKTELFRLISIKVQKDIERSLNNMESYIPENFLDNWRKKYWYEKEWY